MVKQKKSAGTILVEQVRSPIGSTRRQRRVLRSLGLRRIRHRISKPDHPSVRGMVNAIPHLVRIVDESAPAAGKGAQKSKKD
jgi:large subunit ribosomal protein L30